MSNLQSLHFNVHFAGLRLKAALFRLRSKANFDPNQPRVPAGNPDGGQWTESIGAGGRSSHPLGENSPNRVVRDRTGNEPWSSYVSHYRSGGSTASRIVANRSGSTIIASYPSPDIEHDLITLPDGRRLTFEND
jgi:hypothetical protein